MATSGNTVYSVTRDNIITYAYQLISAIGEGETPSTQKVTDADMALNIMIKAWIAHGLQLWKVEEVVINPLVLGQATYTIGVGGDASGPRPRRILEAIIRDGTNNDVPLVMLTREEYWLLNDKTLQAKPTQYYYDRQNDLSEFNIWPTADATSVSTRTIHLQAVLPLEDMDSASDTFDFPQEWYEALAFNLAYRLSFIEGIKLEERGMLRNAGNEMLALALSANVEQGSVYFQPDSRKAIRG